DAAEWNGPAGWTLVWLVGPRPPVGRILAGSPRPARREPVVRSGEAARERRASAAGGAVGDTECAGRGHSPVESAGAAGRAGTRTAAARLRGDARCGTVRWKTGREDSRPPGRLVPPDAAGAPRGRHGSERQPAHLPA